MKANIFKEDTDINIVKSWLVGSTDGAPYSIKDRYLKLITNTHIVDFTLTKYPSTKPVYRYDFHEIEDEWDAIVGCKYDFSVDDPELDEVAERIDKELKELIANINQHPERYFEEIKNNNHLEYYWVKQVGRITVASCDGVTYSSEEKCWTDMMAYAMKELCTTSQIIKAKDVNNKVSYSIEFKDENKVIVEQYSNDNLIERVTYMVRVK